MSDVIFLYRYTRRWIVFPKLRSIQAAWPTVSRRDLRLIARYTRHWIHYGLFAHIAVCTLIGDIEGVFGR
jgi:hypothetical protein